MNHKLLMGRMELRTPALHGLTDTMPDSDLKRRPPDSGRSVLEIVMTQRDAGQFRTDSAGDWTA